MPIATASKPMIVFSLGVPVLAVMSVFGLLLYKGYSLWEYPGLIINGHLTWYIHLFGWVSIVLWIWAFWPKSFDAWQNPVLIEESGDYIILRDWPHPISKDKISQVIYQPFSAVRKIVIIQSSGQRIDQAAFLFSQDGYEVADRLRKLSHMDNQ